jgi:hypothetical protein
VQYDLCRGCTHEISANKHTIYETHEIMKLNYNV